MQENDEHIAGTFTAAGTNINAVKLQNEQAGMSYNEVKAMLAKTTGGHGTKMYSDTNVDEVRKQNQQSDDGE